ncbi:hypothetical protein B0G84_5747 [Paraburkholderia sp. BL8N3]|nr:hypothetical protein [Paraburkholderia sp. BL8N3]TCK36734.1 hypothetical protein B0G84_5747 [Paraburkholderia sp. BL8N3]
MGILDAPGLTKAAGDAVIAEASGFADAAEASAAAAAASAEAAAEASSATSLRGTAWTNFKKSNTQKLSTIIARGQSSHLRGRIVIIGDSYSAGYGAGDGDNPNGGRAKCYSSKLASLMALEGINARADWTVGTAFTDTIAELIAYDPRLTFTGCTILDDFNAIGGRMIQLGTATDRMTFTPGNTFDTVEILVASNNQAGVSGNFDVLLNGTSTIFTTIASNDLRGMKKATVSVPATTTAVSVRGKTNSTFIAGIGTRMSTNPGIEIINGAATGQKLFVQATPPTTTGDAETWNNRAASSALLDTNALNCTILNGWYNDKNGAGRTVAQMQADLTTLITFYKQFGDVIFLGYVPLNPADTSLVDFNTWQNAAFATCTAADIPYINPPAQSGDNATLMAQGMFGDAGLHFGSAGHALIARMLLGAFETIV